MLNLTFFILGLLSLLSSVIIAIGYFKNYKYEDVRKISNWFSLTFISFFLFTMLFFAWSFNFMDNSESDLYIIYLVSAIFFLLLVMKMVFLFTHDKLIYYYLFMLLIIGIFSFFISGLSFFVIYAICNFLLILISFHYLIRREECRRFGFLLISYASFSILLELFLITKLISIFTLIILSMIFFIILAFYFTKDVSNFPRHINKIHYKKESKAISFVRYFIFVLILFNLILLSSLVIHEFGHIASAKMLDCEYKAYLFEENGRDLQTEVLCGDQMTVLEVALGGVLSVIILSFLLFLIGGALSKAISHVMVGIGIIISSKDLVNIGLSESIVLLLGLVGIIFIILGVIKLSKYRFNEVF